MRLLWLLSGEDSELTPVDEADLKSFHEQTPQVFDKAALHLG